MGGGLIERRAYLKFLLRGEGPIREGDLIQTGVIEFSRYIYCIRSSGWKRLLTDASRKLMSSGSFAIFVCKQANCLQKVVRPDNQIN